MGCAPASTLDLRLAVGKRSDGDFGGVDAGIAAQQGMHGRMGAHVAIAVPRIDEASGSKPFPLR